MDAFGGRVFPAGQVASGGEEPPKVGEALWELGVGSPTSGTFFSAM